MTKKRPISLEEIEDLSVAPVEHMGDLQITDEIVGEGFAPPPLSKTVFDLDKWSLRKGETLAKDKNLKLGINKHEAADLHAAMFEMLPQFAENPEDELRAQFVHELMESPDWHSLRDQTIMDPWATEAAMPCVSQKWVTLKEQIKKEREKNKKNGDPTGGEGSQREHDMIAVAASTATKDAQKGIEEMNDAAAAFGLGAGSGGSLDMQAIKRLLQRTSKSERLKEIVNLAGRFRHLAAARQRIKADHGMDEMIGIRTSDDMPRVLPSELMMLKDPVLKYDALRRIGEKQLLTRQHQGWEKVAKGPIMVWVDESGSMDGERIATAKALALAMAWIARKQKRWCSLVGFSCNGQTKSLALPPGKWDEEKLIEWCEHFFCGGTTIPFKDAEKLFAETGAPRGKTDILIVTDGETYSDDKTIAQFTDWKKENKARVISLVLDCTGETIRPYSDELHKMGSLSVEEAGVQAAVSI